MGSSMTAKAGKRVGWVKGWGMMKKAEMQSTGLSGGTTPSHSDYINLEDES